MGFWQPVSNLRDYVSHNPPRVTFFVCLLTLAVSFISLSFYSYAHILPNPDATKDWNHLLSSLSQFQLCMKANTSSSLVSIPVMNKDSLDNIINTSVTTLHLKVPLAVTANSDSGSFKGLGLHITLRAEQLYLGGTELVNLTLLSCDGDSYTCLTISAQRHILPTRLLPPQCPTSMTNISYIHMEASDQLPTASQTCFSLHSKNDPTLTVMLTREEQNVAVQHMLEVSVCLFGICLLLCITASMKCSLLHHYSWNGQL